MTNIYEVYTKDENYQRLMRDYFNSVDLIKTGLNKGIYDMKQIKELSDNMNANLAKNIQEWNQTKMQELKNEQAEIKASYQKDVGYNTDRAKELEMKYKLMGDHELANEVTDLNTTDLLEINLLRMELKNRNMNDDESKAKSYVIEHQLENQHENDERYNQIPEYMSVISQVGDRSVIKLGEYHPLDNVQQELTDIVKHAMDNPKKVKDLGQFLQDQRELENRAKELLQ